MPVFDGERIVAIEEKPADPKSRYAVTGMYMFDGRVFDFISHAEAVGRGELEIADVHNRYIGEGELALRRARRLVDRRRHVRKPLPRERTRRPGGARNEV